jgi:hypothetical protein
MIKVLQKISVLIMASVVLISTMSFTINLHYCGDTLVETSLFHKAEGCGMEMDTPLTESCSITKNNCCDDEQLLVEGQDELQLTFDKISFDQKVFLTSFVHTYISLFEVLEKNIHTYKQYRPPLVIRSIYKFDETYLI